MPCKCKGICIKYETHETLYQPYKHGYKRCNICEIYFKYDGNLCPCCGNKLRSKYIPAPKKLKAGCSYVCVLCNWRVDVSSKIKSIICQRCQQRNKTPLRAKINCKHCGGTQTYYWVKGTFRSVCDECRKVSMKKHSAQWYQDHKAELKITNHEKYLNNKDEISLKGKVYYITHKDKIKATVKKWRDKNPEKLKQYSDKYWNSPKGQAKRKKYYANNKPLVRERAKQWAKDHPERVKECQDNWRNNNKDKIHASQKKWRQSPAGKAYQKIKNKTQKHNPYNLENTKIRSVINQYKKRLEGKIPTNQTKAQLRQKLKQAEQKLEIRIKEHNNGL